MSKSKFNPLITASVMSAVCLAGLSSSDVVFADTQVASLTSLTAEYIQNDSSMIPEANALGQRRYIILFNESSLAHYNGTGSFAAIPRGEGNRLLSQSDPAQAYVTHLEQQQDQFLSSLDSAFNRNVNSVFTYQYALNGVVVELTAVEANTVKSMPGVKMVEMDKEYTANTDAGPQLIGADNVWTGTAPSSGMAFGEGVVVGVLDTGANYDHPSFADVGDDAYDHTNPLGSGNYLGVCDPTNVDQYLATYTCNDKIIGGYDFVNDITPAGGTDIPGPEDENGHGTHTASTAAGNLVTTAEANGVAGITVSGVARHANVIMFDVCYTPAPGAGGGCFGSAAAESVDQMLADGVVDVINYSISGGVSPWGEAASLAFLSAVDSGIFVAASAGNAGPGAGTLGHIEPWTSSSGASTHNRRFSNALTVSGPSAVDPSLVDALSIQGTGPVLAVDMAGTLVYAGDVDAANFEGCVAFPASSFDGLIPVISRGSCSFADKLSNSEAAGATSGVIVHNNIPGADPIVMGALEASTIPSVMVSFDVGTDMVTYIQANPGTAAVNVAAITTISLAGTADSMASFSSRGPSPLEVNKPDVTGPGSSILAGFADSDPATGTPAEYGVISGTSMSSPHNAGAAALLKELHPSWTAPEIKSALMLTAVTAGVTKEDQTTPADPFDRGAGRIQVDVASSTGLVMNETAFKFLLADPADGGDPKSLNLASYKNDNCIGTCTFQRKFRSVAAVPVDYTAELSGMTGTVNPASFTAMPGQTVTINVEIDGGALVPGDVSFGELQIIPPDPANPGLAVPDDGYDGSLGSMACAEIPVSGAPVAPADVQVGIGMDHTWIGDLAIKVENSNGDVLGLMSRPGFVDTVDDGTGGFGDSTNLTATAPITFSDSAATSAEDMGNTIGTADFVCQTDSICEYTPEPGSIAQPPTTLADLLATDPNGNWTVCVGDSAGGDTGILQSVALSFDGVPVEVAGFPMLHLPLVVTGLPEAPDIAVDPTSLSATLDADTTTDLILNISNSDLAGADLNWTFGAGDFSLVYAEQSDGTGSITNGIVSGFFLQDNGGAGSGAYSADDFVLSQDASIETMFFGGFANGVTLGTSATGIQVQVFADNAGLPDGHPEDGLGSALFALDIPIADGSLDLTDNNILIDIVAANGGASLDLPSGTYWVTVFPTQDSLSNSASRWNWFAAGPDVADSPAQLISPISFGLPDWNNIAVLTAEPNFEQLVYNIAGSSSCGAPWITTSSAGSVVVPGGDIDVTVTLDATGIAAGVYTATLCVDSDDPDEPQVLVPVTMTVEGLSDIIFENGFEAIAP